MSILSTHHLVYIANAAEEGVVDELLIGVQVGREDIHWIGRRLCTWLLGRFVILSFARLGRGGALRYQRNPKNKLYLEVSLQRTILVLCTIDLVDYWLEDSLI